MSAVAQPPAASSTRAPAPRERGLRLGPVLLTLPAAVALLAFLIAPLAAFAVYSFLTGSLYEVSGPLTLENYREIAQSELNRTLARNSVIVGLLAAVSSVVVALPIAYWLRYTKSRTKSLVLFLIVASFLASYLVRIYAWRTILGAEGVINSGLGALGVIDEPLDVPGLQPLRGHARARAHLPALRDPGGLRGLGPLQPAYLEAAQDLGAGWVQRWRRVVLPAVAAPAASALLFVFVLSAADYVTPQFLGGTSNVMIGVQVQVAFQGTGDYAGGAAISFALLAGFLDLLRRRRARPAARKARPAAVRVVRPGRFTGLVTVAGMLFLWLPLLVVVLFSLHKTASLSFPFDGFSLRWYERIFENPEVRAAARNSLVVATSTALVTLVLATLAAYGMSRSRSRWRAPLALLFFLPITLPGLFIGVALLIAFSRLEYSLSLVTVTIAHLVYVFPFFFLLARAALERLDPALEEAAADLGATGWTIFRRVTLPQVWPVLVGAACLAFALSFDEFIITFFIVGPDPDAAAVHLVEPAPHDRPFDQRDLDAAARLHGAAVRDHLRARELGRTAAPRDRRPARPDRHARARMSGDPRVRIEGVSHRYGAVTALDDVSLDIADGEFVTLLGPSGCGKTTLLRIVAGFERPSGGRVLLAGEDVTGRPAHRRATNMVFQRPTLFPHLDVFANVAFGLQVAGVGRADQRARVSEALELVRLEGYERRRSHELSGGQMQRIALARALVNRPKVLLLDEPLSALDLKIRLDMEVELRRVHRETGATFVYVTHDQREAMALSDRIAVMNAGRVEQVGAPTDVYRHPASVFAAQFVGDANVLPVEVVDAGEEESTVQLGDCRHQVRCPRPQLGPAWLVLRPEAIEAAGRGELRRLVGRRARRRLPRHRLQLPHRAARAWRAGEGRGARSDAAVRGRRRSRDRLVGRVVLAAAARARRRRAAATTRLRAGVRPGGGACMSGTALVTGAARGMGAEVARLLAHDGFAVAVADVRGCEPVAQELRAAGFSAAAYDCDVRDWDAVIAVADAAERELGPLRTAVQVAGVYRMVPFLQMRPDQWRQVLEVNVDGTFNVLRVTAERIAANGGGSVVAIASTAAWLAWDDSTHYLASKAAINGLVRGIAYELGSRGVRANAVAPGTIRTPATAGELAEPGVEAAEAAACPLGRVGETTDVAQAVRFLCDEERAAWITGHMLVVDGGYSTHGANSGFGSSVDTTTD